MTSSIQTILENEWVIGIGTGLIGTLIVAVVNFFAKRVKRRESYVKAEARCIELFLHYIDKNGIPNDTAILAVFSVVAKEYGLEPEKINKKTILEKLLIQLIEQKKYSQGRTKSLLAGIEDKLSNINIVQINVDEIIEKDEYLASAINDTIAISPDSIKGTYPIIKTFTDVISIMMAVIIAMDKSFVYIFIPVIFLVLPFLFSISSIAKINKRLVNVITALVLFGGVISVGWLGYKTLISNQIDPISVKITNNTANSIVISNSHEFWLWEPALIDSTFIEGKYEFVDAIPSVEIPSGEYLYLKAQILNTAKFYGYYKNGDCDISLWLRIDEKLYNTKGLAFSKDAFGKYYIEFDIN